MDEIPELPVIVEPPPVEPIAPPVTARTLIRDAVFDLGAALGTGFGLILCAAVVVALVLVFSGSDPRRIGDLFASPLGIAAMLFATQLPLLYFALRRRRRNAEKQRPMIAFFQPVVSNAVPMGVLTGFVLTVVSALYSGALLRMLGEGAVQSQVEFLQDILDNKPAVGLLIFIIAVVAPVCEEVFFRGVIFGSAHATGLSKVGIAISAGLFSLVHLSFLLVPFYALFAVVMCRLYVKTGTLAAPIAAHMTLNGVACAALVFAPNGNV